MHYLFLLCAVSIANRVFVAPLLAQQTTTGTTSSTSSVNGGASVSVQLGGSSAPALRMMQPVIGQPYSLLETTTWEHIRPDGTRSTTTSQRRLMRDTEGRTRTEAGALGAGMVAQTIVVDDPVQFTLTVINPTKRTATVSIYNRTPPLTAEEEAQRNERIEKVRLRGGPAPVVEKLPTTIIEGVVAEGTRNTRVIPAGCMGNNTGSDIQVISETWTSPELKIVLRSSSDNPLTGKTSKEVTELKREAPDPAFFQVPEGYEVTERERRTTPMASGLTSGVGLPAPAPCRAGTQ